MRRQLGAVVDQRPAWHIRHAGDDHPGQLGYIATRDNIRITAENLVRLGDRIADADRGQRPGALMIGRAGWNSGPMPDLTADDLAAVVSPRGWEVSDLGDHVTAQYRLGSMVRLLAGRTAAELAVRTAEAEAAMPALADPAGLLAEIAADHPTWAVGPAPHGQGVEAVRGDVHLWAHSAAELGALLDVADPAL